MTPRASAALVAVAIAGALASSCGGAQGGEAGVVVLPAALREVSGVAAIDAHRVACVQDERGTVFEVDLRDGTVRGRPFGERGDYEGVARVGERFWVLRSDGWLGEVGEQAGVGGELHVLRSVRLPDGHREWESLCHDAARARLLVCPKGGADGDKDARDERPVFAVSLPDGAIAPEPVLVLSRRGLLQQAEARGIALRTRTTPKGVERAVLALQISELAVVPGGDDLLVLCAGDALLLRVDRTGALLAARRLDRELLPQAEGLTFLPAPDGRLLVASEGAGGRARLATVPLPLP